MKILDKIKDSLHTNLPFVAYRKPNEKKIAAFFQENNNLHTTENYKEAGFVFAPFDDRKPSVLIPLDCSGFYEEEVEEEVEEVLSLNAVAFSNEESRGFHLEIVKKAIQEIEEGEFKKVVLSRKEVIERKDVVVVNTFKKLLDNYKNACVYVWFHPKVGLWMGATPETLIKVSGSFFETMSLAGTQRHDINKEVHWEAKEIDEQQLVTDYVLDKLKLVAKSVKSSKVETVRAGDLLHLKTNISGHISNSVSELIAVLHPTPAVCGFPKGPSKKFILKNEGYNRGFYTGFLGEINMPKSELFVNLRCMELKEETINIYVGGGITKESIPEKEWVETVAKSKTIKNVL